MTYQLKYKGVEIDDNLDRANKLPDDASIPANKVLVSNESNSFLLYDKNDPEISNVDAHRSLQDLGLGSRVWSFQVTGKEPSYSTPIGPYTISDGFEYKKVILVCSWDWHIYALDVTDGSQIWRTSTGLNIYGRPQAADVNGDNRLEVFVPSHNGFIRRYTDEGVWDGWELQNVYDREGSGTITTYDSGTNTITDTSQDWAENAFLRINTPSTIDEAEFNAVIEMTSGDALGETRFLSTVNGDTLTFFGDPFDVAPTAGDTFTITPYSVSDKYFMHAGQLIEEAGTWFLYATSFDSHCYKVNAVTGDIVWKVAALEQTEPWPWVGDLLGDASNKVIYGNLDGKLRCLNANDGSLLWEVEIGGVDATVNVAPTGPAGINEVYISGRSGMVYKIQASDGTILEESGRPQNWQDISSSPIPMKRSDDNWQIITGGNRGNAQAFDLEMFNRWSRYATQDNINSSPRFHDITGDGKLDIVLCDMVGHCHTYTEDGNTIGKFYAKGPIEGMPLVADIDGDGNTEMVVTTLDGFIHCFRFTNGFDNETDGLHPDAINMPIPADVPTFSPENLFLTGDNGAYHDMGPDAVMWQDTGKTVTANNGDPVRVVEDLSGNGHDWVAPSDAERPTRVIDGTEGYLLFSGTHKMEISGSESTFSFLHKAAEHSVCVAVQPAETASDAGRGILSSAGADPSVVGYDIWHDSRSGATNLNYEASNGGALIMSIQDNTVTNTQKLVVYTNADGSAARLRVDNTSIDALGYFNTPSTADSASPLTLGHLPAQGGGFFMDGRVYSTFIIDKDLRNVDRNEVKRHFGSLLGLTITVN